ncbi:MAG TPA: tryptophan synthase subunit alpha, partial [Desulfotomaculum sp.]|nr:tryptophan synthase subunit alpha [Desulfotomaculum sp.]
GRARAVVPPPDKFLGMVERFRKVCCVPRAFMTYVNPVFTSGAGLFMKTCRETGFDAIIVPGLPFEEKEELLPYCSEFGIDLISLIAPTSRDRIRMIAGEARGFVYCVSSMGVTGVRKEISADVGEMIKLVKEVRDIPCAVGFGISTPEQAAKMAGLSDGVIVGSAIVKIVEQYGEGCVPHVAEYVRAMKKAVS